MQGQYDKDWPIRDALKLRLKYSSDFGKKKEQRKMHSVFEQVCTAANDAYSYSQGCLKILTGTAK